MLLQAAHMGLDSCPIGGFDADALTTALALPTGESLALLIALGHCSNKALERLRKAL
jgi:nitroreductase